jgi:cystinosin
MVVFFTAYELPDSLIHAGNDTEVLNSTVRSSSLPFSTQIDVSTAFVQLHIGRSALLHTLSWTFGWCYFFSWILSMYPQCIVNFRRKSVVGLNLDYVALCLVGYIAYAIFNVCFTWVPLFRQTYKHYHPHSNIPVQINDVLFSLHGVAATLVLAIQCAIYERGEQRICQRVHRILISVYSPSIVLSVMLLCSQLEPLSYIYFFSYVKMGLTVAKYIPQVVFNYRRQSTAGWSIHNIILDLNGGILSVGQMALLAINFGEFSRTKVDSPTIINIFPTFFVCAHR